MKYRLNYNDKKELIIQNVETEEETVLTLYRIQALIDIPGIVSAGDLGGYVENGHTLSQEGKCWIDETSAVCHNSKIMDDAQIKNNSLVLSGSIIKDNTEINNSWLLEMCHIIDDVTVRNKVLSESCLLSGSLLIDGNKTPINFFQEVISIKESDIPYIDSEEFIEAEEEEEYEEQEDYDAKDFHRHNSTITIRSDDDNPDGPNTTPEHTAITPSPISVMVPRLNLQALLVSNDNMTPTPIFRPISYASLDERGNDLGK